MDQEIPEFDKAQANAMKGLDDLGIGEIFSSTDMVDWDKSMCTFCIERSDERELTPEQAALAVTTLQDHGFRIVKTGFHLGRTVLRTFLSIRTHGTVERCVQRLRTVLIVLEGSNRLVHVPLDKVESEIRLLLTQKGDRIVIWEDVVGEWTEGVSEFENLDLPTLV